MKNKSKYSTIFSAALKPLVSEEKDKYLAMASLLDVGDFIPDIDVEKNIDLLPVAFNACVVNRVNKNGDVIAGDLAASIFNSFINKPINLEHNRTRVVGTILASGFSEFGTDRPLTEDQVKEMEGPFNITLGGVIWRVVSSELTDLIEESNDPTSEHYQGISASWELGFEDFHIVALHEGEKNIENAEYFTEAEQIDLIQEKLSCLGGEGKIDDGRMIYRQVIGTVIPLGIGLTETPAADVVGVAVNKRKEGVKIMSSEEENISQTVENDVIQDVHSKQRNNSAMKIESLKDITEESVKTLTASAVSDFIEEEVEKASEKFVQERDSAQTTLKETEEKYATISTENELTQTELEKLKAELDAVKAEMEAKEKEDAFNERMSSFDENYELSDKDREVIASDIKDLDDDGFKSYEGKMEVLLSEKNRTNIAAKAETKTEEEVKAETKEEVVAEEAKASEETQEVVEEAVEEAEVINDPIANTTDASEGTVYEKYKSAFGLDQFDIKL